MRRAILLLASLPLAACGDDGSGNSVASGPVSSDGKRTATEAPAPAVTHGEVLHASWTYDAALIPDNLVLTLHNSAEAAACVPRINVDEAPMLSQRGIRVSPRVTSSRKMLMWKEADLIAGMTVIPPGKSVGIFYNLSRWELQRGAAKIDISLPVYDCLAFFDSPHPTARWLQSSFRFER